jgi:hypothetical protein
MNPTKVGFAQPRMLLMECRRSSDDCRCAKQVPTLYILLFCGLVTTSALVGSYRRDFRRADESQAAFALLKGCDRIAFA